MCAHARASGESAAVRCKCCEVALPLETIPGVAVVSCSDLLIVLLAAPAPSDGSASNSFVLSREQSMCE